MREPSYRLSWFNSKDMPFVRKGQNGNFAIQ